MYKIIIFIGTNKGIMSYATLEEYCEENMPLQRFALLEKKQILDIELKTDSEKVFFKKLVTECKKHNVILPVLSKLRISFIDLETESTVLAFLKDCFPEYLQKLVLECQFNYLALIDPYIHALQERKHQIDNVICFTFFEIPKGSLEFLLSAFSHLEGVIQMAG